VGYDDGMMQENERKLYEALKAYQRNPYYTDSEILKVCKAMLLEEKAQVRNGEG